MSSLYIYADVAKDPLLSYISAGIAVVASILSIPSLRSGIAILSGLMLLTGAVLMISQGIPLSVALSSMTSNLPLVSLITVAPIALVPLTVGGYVSSIHRVSRDLMSHSDGLVSAPLASAFVLGSVFNISALRLVMSFLDPVSTTLHGREIASGLGRGFCAAILWSPYFAAVGLVLQFTKVPFGLYLGTSLVGAALWLGAAYIWGRRENAGRVDSNESSFEFTVQDDGEQSLAKVVGLVSTMFVQIVIFDLFAPWGLLTSVSLVIVLMSLIWILVEIRGKEFIRVLLQQYIPQIYFARNEIVLFLTAGFFGKMLSQSSAREWLLAVGGQLNHLWVFLTCIIIMSVISFLSIIGVHQAVSTMLILSTWPADVIGLTPLGMALLLIGSWAVSTSVSPITPVNMILSELAKENPLKVGLVWNWKFAVVAGALFCSYVTIVDSVMRALG